MHNENRIKILGYRCSHPGCQAMMLMDKPTLDAHMLELHQVLQCPCPLEGCAESFADLNQLSDHFVEKHSALTAFRCQVCSLVCSSYLTLLKHQSMVHLKGVFQVGKSLCVSRLSVQALYYGKLTPISVLLPFPSVQSRTVPSPPTTVSPSTGT